MGNSSIQTISFIGAGNVASHLARELHKKKLRIVQVWSGHLINSTSLAKEVDAEVCTDLSNLNLGVDLLIISVKDDALKEVIGQLPSNLVSVVHTSGSLEMKMLQNIAHNIGVFYPVQSFKKNELVDWKNVPICIEAGNDIFTEQLFALGKELSGQVEYLNSSQRVQLHVAAIFANNFSNYLFSIAYELLTKQKLPFSLLVPLIRQTAARLDQHDPFDLQTGPAKRQDLELIKKHVDLLASNKSAQEVYEFLSKEIIKKDRE